MAISIGATLSNSGNQTNSSGFSFNHTTDSNTKCLVVVITGYDSSATDSAISSVTWNGVAMAEIPPGRFRNASDFQSIWYLSLPAIGGAYSITVTPGGTCTDIQATAINLVDSSAYSIVYDSYDTTAGTGSASGVVNPAASGSYAVGGGVAVGGTPASLSITAGTEASGSEVDMGSQTASVGYAAASGGTATITWSYSSVACTCLVATFKPQNTPTVALDSPADSGSTSDTTPDLLFTGTDAEGDDIRYNLQIDKTTVFNGTVDSCSDSTNSVRCYTGSYTAAGQSFTGQSGPINSAAFYLWAYGSPTGSVVAKLYSHSGTFGSSSVPGSLLATSDSLDVATQINHATDTEKTFTFSGTEKYYIESSTHYVIVLEFTSTFSDSSNFVTVTCKDSAGTHSGNRSRFDGSWGYTAGADLTFSVTKDSLLDKYSNVDTSEFTRGGDSDPFTSGQQVTYTVPGGSALSAGTYYWRVRGLDPSGTNAYGAWATTRSFTVTTGDPIINNSFRSLLGVGK